MNKITKEVIARIKAGYYDDLIDAIEYLIDTYNEDKFDEGYKARISDEAVVAQRLAEYIHDESDKRGKLGKDNNEEPISYLEVDETAKIIEDYFNEALKTE